MIVVIPWRGVLLSLVLMAKLCDRETDKLSPTANLDSSYGRKGLALSAFPLERDGH